MLSVTVTAAITNTCEQDWHQPYTWHALQHCLHLLENAILVLTVEANGYRILHITAQMK